MTDSIARFAPDGARLPLLVGRDGEQARLRERLAATLTGAGSLVLIGGEAGIGKTALAEALCQEAVSQGILVLVGRCYASTDRPASLSCSGPVATSRRRRPRCRVSSQAAVRYCPVSR